MAAMPLEGCIVPPRSPGFGFPFPPLRSRWPVFEAAAARPSPARVAGTGARVEPSLPAVRSQRQPGLTSLHPANLNQFS